MSCTACGAPERTVWPPRGGWPELEDTEVDGASYMWLKRCRRCGERWAVVPHEPYGSFHYAVLWPHADEDFARLDGLDRGETLHRWHSHRLRAEIPRMRDADEAAVKAHRSRCGGRLPWREPAPPVPDLPALLEELRGR